MTKICTAVLEFLNGVTNLFIDCQAVRSSPGQLVFYISKVFFYPNFQISLSLKALSIQVVLQTDPYTLQNFIVTNFLKVHNSRVHTSCLRSTKIFNRPKSFDNTFTFFLCSCHFGASSLLNVLNLIYNNMHEQCNWIVLSKYQIY